MNEIATKEPPPRASAPDDPAAAAAGAHAEEGYIPLPALFDAAKNVVLDRLHSELNSRGYPEIRAAHGCVFRFVGADGMRLTELAELNSMTKQAVGEVVADLEEMGYVERSPDPSDRRAKLIRLTERGVEAQATARKVFAEIESEWSDRLGVKRVREMRETLAAVLGG